MTCQTIISMAIEEQVLLTTINTVHHCDESADATRPRKFSNKDCSASVF